MYYFLSGYTAKVAGTERGVKEPQATFSACFGAVFLVWHPSRYAQMLGTLLEKHNAQVWLVNTGWTGGPYGVGERMKLGHTRAMVRAALAGELTGAPTTTDPMFGLAVPEVDPRCARRAALAAQHVDGSRGVRRAGAHARADVREELRAVRERRGSGRARRGPARVRRTRT